MKIIKYKVEIGLDKRNVLVKESESQYDGADLVRPEIIGLMLNDLFHLDKLAEEYVYIIAMTKSCEPLGVFEVSHGGVGEAYLNPREVFVRLLLVGAASFVVVHNHPSGNPSPSECDKKITERLIKCAELIGIDMLDHIIIGKTVYSFRKNEMNNG